MVKDGWFKEPALSRPRIMAPMNIDRYESSPSQNKLQSAPYVYLDFQLLPPPSKELRKDLLPLSGDANTGRALTRDYLSRQTPTTRRLRATPCSTLRSAHGVTPKERAGKTTPRARNAFQPLLRQLTRTGASKGSTFVDLRLSLHAARKQQHKATELSERYLRSRQKIGRSLSCALTPCPTFLTRF